MKVTRTASAAFTAEFESDEELRAEHAANLSFGALALPTEESVARDTALVVTLRGAGGGEAQVKATVVAAMPGKLALQIDADPDDLLKRLSVSVEDRPSGLSSWDRVRGLSQMEKLLLAVKADRSERAIMAQDNDPRVLLSLLRNPRLTVDEVVRVAKSSFLTFQIADVIMKAPQWSGNLDVRVALIHNPKTPPAFQMRMLPTLPEAEIRTIARGGTNMALKTAALRLLQAR
ncbi:MAG TPA: hypothetical protein VI670_21085 [Thermoanaerobaculia bacterium]|jgi:hypothetical protein